MASSWAFQGMIWATTTKTAVVWSRPRRERAISRETADGLNR
jgi:hypothetical protein